MLALSWFDVPPGTPFTADADAALRALGARPGFVRGRVAEAVERPGRWVLQTEWDGVGSYRRALSAYDVKLATAALLPYALDEPGAYDVATALEAPTAVQGGTGVSQRAR